MTRTYESGLSNILIGFLLGIAPTFRQYMSYRYMLRIYTSREADDTLEYAVYSIVNLNSLKTTILK